MKDVQEAVRKLAAIHAIPSWSLSVFQDGATRFCHTEGFAQVDPPRATSHDQVYDLASLTKVIAGVSALAALVEQGEVRLEQTVRTWIDSIDPTMTVAHLLNHSAGYPAWAALYDQVSDWGTPLTREQVIDAAVQTPLSHPPGHTHVYSDLGFLTLLRVIERASNQRIDAYLDSLPWFEQDPWSLSWGQSDAAATEMCPVREGLIRGQVHDLNTCAMGGVSSHAGLFGSARGVGRFADAFCRALLAPGTTTLPGHALRVLFDHPVPAHHGHRGGWDTVSMEGYTSTGKFFPPDAIGHLGYTGTSLWIVPSKATSIVLLTNRIHPTDDKQGIRAFRPAVHDAVSQALGWDRSLA